MRTVRPNTTRINRILGTAAGVTAFFGFLVSAGGQAAAAEVHGWRTATTEHFVVQAVLDDQKLADLGERCESLLDELRAKWFDDGVAADWAPRCLVVVHGSSATYLQAVPGGEQTLGSTWIETSKGEIVTRRVDLRADRADWFAGALAHELVHVLLADRVGGYPPARWAEEGLAILADPTVKQELHEADFRAAAARGADFRLAEMLGHSEYPDPSRITAFYGQSASLVRFLIKFRTPADFSAFLKHAASYGYDAALRNTYGINGIADLERRWLNSVHSDELAIR